MQWLCYCAVPLGSNVVIAMAEKNCKVATCPHCKAVVYGSIYTKSAGGYVPTAKDKLETDNDCARMAKKGYLITMESSQFVRENLREHDTDCPLKPCEACQNVGGHKKTCTALKKLQEAQFLKQQPQLNFLDRYKDGSGNCFTDSEI